MVDGSDIEEQCYSAHVETVEGLLDITNLPAVGPADTTIISVWCHTI